MLGNQLAEIWTPRMLAVLRIVTALLFLEHGTQSLLGFPPSDHATISPFSLLGFAGQLELVGGVLILLGLFTRPAAFVLAGEMAFAYFFAHSSQKLWPVNSGGDAPILFCFVFLYLLTAGSGAWSLDNMMQASRGWS
jgi:putative oxidoreductase